MKRKYAVITGKGEVRTMEEKMRQLKKNEVLIKVHASLISPGTEMAAVKNSRNNPDPKKKPIAFGYANAGEVIDVKSNVNGIKKGTRVAAMGGGYAQHTDYAAVPANLVIPIPEEVSYEDATYACLGATSLQAVRRTVPQLGEYGIVLGLGIVGNLAAQLSQLSGARVLAWEGFKNRIKVAKKCGISNISNFMDSDTVKAAQEFSSPYGCDFAIFAFGGDATKAYEDIKKCMKKSPDTHEMGRLTFLGGQITFSGGAAAGNLNILASSRTGAGYHDEAYEYGADYPNAFIQFTTQRNLREIIQLIAEKRLLVTPMTSHRMSLDDVGKAADLLIEKPDKSLGIILHP